MKEENEDRKQEKEAAAYFFKVMLIGFAHKLRIPPAFVHNLRDKVGKDVVLRGPNGKGLFVRLCGTNTEMEFGQGWGNFVHDHTIELGDFLVFKYVCKSYFKVIIFGRSACQKRLPGFHSYHGEKKNDQAEVTVKQPKNPSSSGRGRGHPTKNTGYCQSVGESNERKKPKYSGRGPHRPLKNTGYCQSVAGNKRQKLKSAETETGEKTYQGVYYASRRRPVTEAERNKTLEAVSSFTSKKPFCSMIMKPSHVYQGFWLGIKKTCIDRLQLPSKRLEVTLVDPKNREWPVQYLGTGKVGFSGGWRYFSLANNLEEGDVCIFELVDNSETELKFRVHIFRVVNKCSAYKRIEGTGTPDTTALSTNLSRKKMKVGTVPRKDLAINLSEKAFGSEQEKNTEPRVKKMQGKNGNDFLEQLKGKLAIYDRKAGFRRSPRLTQTCNLVKCPKKELCPAPSIDGQKSISREELALSKKITYLYDVNENGEEDLMIIWDNNNANHVMAPTSGTVILSQESIHKGPLMEKSIPLVLNQKPEVSSLEAELLPKEATSLLDMNVEDNSKIGS